VNKVLTVYITQELQRQSGVNESPQSADDLKRCVGLVNDVVSKVKRTISRRELAAIKSDFQSRVLDWKELGPYKMHLGALLLFDVVGFIIPNHENKTHQASTLSMFIP
jgi:hypothetical protein